MKKIGLIILIILSLGFSYAFEQLSLTDVPTAGLLQRGEIRVFSKIFRENGTLVGAQVGLFPRLMFGVSYGGVNIVGNETPEWNSKVEFNAKFRAFDETAKMPAIVIGYDSQGHGRFYDNQDRFDIKSKGFYAVASRNFSFLGSFGFHLGLNRSMEDEDDKDINLFMGIDKSIGKAITITCEYDAALNDSENKIQEELYGSGKGYLNASAYINFTDSILLKVSAYDILENSERTNGMDRSISLIYFSKF